MSAAAPHAVLLYVDADCRDRVVECRCIRGAPAWVTALVRAAGKQYRFAPEAVFCDLYTFECVMIDESRCEWHWQGGCYEQQPAQPWEEWHRDRMEALAAAAGIPPCRVLEALAAVASQLSRLCKQAVPLPGFPVTIEGVVVHAEGRSREDCDIGDDVRMALRCEPALAAALRPALEAAGLGPSCR